MLHRTTEVDMFAAVHATPPFAPFVRILYVCTMVPEPQLLEHRPAKVVETQFTAGRNKKRV